MKIFFSLIIIIFTVYNISCDSKEVTNHKNDSDIKILKSIENVSDTAKVIFKAKLIITKVDTFNILLELINNGIDSLYVDTKFTVGYDDDEFTNVYYKILKLSNIGVYEEIDEKTADYQYFYDPHKETLLPKGKSIKKNIYGILTMLEKGNRYKIKFFYRLSKYGNYDDICTNWVKFEVH